MDHETAVEFVKRIELTFGHLEKAIVIVKPRLSEEDLRGFGDVCGAIVSELDLGVLEIIYRAHPDLRPEGMKPVMTLGEMDRGCRRKPPPAEDGP